MLRPPLKEVAQEIENLKLRASPEQLSKLDFSVFDPNKPTLCIYGQMTGNCFSDEAERLMLKKYYDISEHYLGSKPHYTGLEFALHSLTDKSIKSIFNYLQGKGEYSLEYKSEDESTDN